MFLLTLSLVAIRGVDLLPHVADFLCARKKKFFRVWALPSSFILTIQYRHHGRWNLSDDLQGRGYTAERDRYGAIWLHFAVRPKDNRRKVSFINA